MEHEEKVPLDLGTALLQIKTNSIVGSEDIVKVYFYDESGANVAGLIQWNFKSPPQYNIGYCLSSWIDFPSPLPTEADKIWTITKLPGPGIKVQCNKVTVVDIQDLSATCTRSIWENYWDEDVKKIRFSDDDTASDSYLSASSGNTK